MVSDEQTGLQAVHLDRFDVQEQMSGKSALDKSCRKPWYADTDTHASAFPQLSLR